MMIPLSKVRCQMSFINIETRKGLKNLNSTVAAEQVDQLVGTDLGVVLELDGGQTLIPWPQVIWAIGQGFIPVVAPAVASEAVASPSAPRTYKERIKALASK